jgi:hypothetical protein
LFEPKSTSALLSIGNSKVSEGGVEPFAYAGVLSADFIIGGAA